MLNPGPVAIIGTGISGLSCAQALRLVGIEVHLFEKADRVGGRCATNLWQGHLVDYGVQYFTAQSVEFKRELLSCLRQFRPIISPILDSEENIIHSQHGARFYVVQGNNYFAHVLSRGLDIRLQAQVETLTSKKDGIECFGQIYPAVIASMPAPQMAHLFEPAQPSAPDGCSLSIVLEYNEPEIGNSEHCYGRVLPPGTEPLSASYCENHKAGRVLNNRTVFVLQAAPAFSREHADVPTEKYIPELARVHEALWKIPSGKLTASFAHRWRATLPSGTPLAPPLPRGAFVCGDSPTGSTPEEVWLAGRRTAAEVLSFLST